jgi:membrane protease YdiL (CAAX protease family)
VQDRVQAGALALVAALAHWWPGEYLGLVRPSGRDTVIALGALGLFIPGWEALGYLLGKTHAPFLDELYLSARTSGVLPLLWFSSLVAAPVSEEIIFRGFLFRGFNRPQRDPVVLTSMFWALSHVRRNGPASSMPSRIATAPTSAASRATRAISSTRCAPCWGRKP